MPWIWESRHALQAKLDLLEAEKNQYLTKLDAKFKQRTEEHDRNWNASTDSLLKRSALLEDRIWGKLAELPENRPIYWSTIQLAGNISHTTHYFFSTPVGQVGQGFGRPLSLAETNLQRGGLYDNSGYDPDTGAPLGAPWKLKGLQLEIWSADADRIRLERKAVLVLRLNQTMHAIGPLTAFQWAIMPDRVGFGRWSGEAPLLPSLGHASFALRLGEDIEVKTPIDVRLITQWQKVKGEG